MNECRDAARTAFHPDITVACVVQREGRFLLVEEHVRGERVLNQPAGHLEPGESLLQAAVRETREETRWDVRLTGLVGVYQWQAPDGVHFLRFAFAAEALSEDPQRALDTGIIQPVWLSRDELLARRATWRSPLVMRAVDDALAAPPRPLDLIRWMA